MQSKENLTFIIEFLGCKVNSYEAECVGNLLLEKGYKEFDENKDKYPTVIVINTCSVTQTSETKDRKVIKQYRKKYKKSILVVMGCYTQREYDYVANELDADIVLGTSKRSLIPEYIDEFNKNHQKIIIHEENNSIKEYEGLTLVDSLLTTRAYLKIQDGCDNYCTYCLIPYIRGRSRSRNKDDILAEVDRLVKLGYKEIVLTGIDMGSYGKDFKNGYTFSDLIYEILSKNKDLYRLRISSLEDSQIDDKFIKCLKEFPNLANHLHIPLQSGSASILKRMNRKYDLKSFKEKVDLIRSVRSDIALTTDVIVGFPGETSEEFEETFNFCKDINFSKIHVFPYSKREGTIAAKLPDQVEEFDKKLRVSKLIALSDIMQNEYNKKFNGQELEFLVENYDESKKAYRAHSSNYLEFYIPSKENIEGKIVKSKYTSEVTINFDNVKKLFSR